MQYQLPTVGLVPGFQLHVHSALVAWTITHDGCCWIYGNTVTLWAYNDGFPVYKTEEQDYNSIPQILNVCYIC